MLDESDDDVPELVDLSSYDNIGQQSVTSSYGLDMTIKDGVSDVESVGQ